MSHFKEYSYVFGSRLDMVWEVYEKFIALIQERGFKRQKELEVPFNEKTMYGVQFYRVDIPFYYNIDELTMNIIDITDNCNGSYDGWESSLVKR